VVQGRIVAIQGAGDDGQAIGGVHGGEDAMSEPESPGDLAPTHPRPSASQERGTPAAVLHQAAMFHARHPLLLPAFVLIAVFLITRLPFFLYYPVVEIGHDTGDYELLSDTIRSGILPKFIIRTPGYPLFIWLVTCFSNRWLAVILVQNLLTLFSSLYLVLSVLRLTPRLALPAALAMCGYVGSSQVLYHDTFTKSDSLYANCVIFSIGFLLSAMSRPRPFALFCSSAMMAITILVRPAGMYLVVIYLVVLAYLAWNRFSRSEFVLFALPLPIIILALCTYNLFTIGEFAISPWGEATFVGATILYWEQDPSLPPFVNNALKELPDSYRKVGLTDEDLLTLRNSWDTGSLFRLYGRASDPLIHIERWGWGSRFTSGDYLQNRKYLRQVSLMAIRKHPALYLKYVWTNLVSYWGDIGEDTDIYPILTIRSSINYVTKNRGFEKWKAKEYADALPPEAVHLGPPGRPNDVTLEPTFLGLVHRVWQSWHWRIFQQTIWNWAFLAVLVLSVIKLIRSRGHHQGAFILSVLGLTVIGACLVICLLARGIERYSYPTQFICYLSVALLPLLWMTPKPGRGEGS
jgi:hypothetical protein